MWSRARIYEALLVLLVLRWLCREIMKVGARFWEAGRSCKERYLQWKARVIIGWRKRRGLSIAVDVSEVHTMHSKTSGLQDSEDNVVFLEMMEVTKGRWTTMCVQARSWVARQVTEAQESLSVFRGKATLEMMAATGFQTTFACPQSLSVLNLK